MNEIKLLPCPFCGGKAYILISDAEGNIHDWDYEQNPWSGLTYQLSHDMAAEKRECPIATHSDETIGARLYESREEAAAAWNGRQPHD